ncbi:MAG: translation initiation factor IF-2 [Sphingomonadales bacterium 35-56-22]|jgi:translation initiation factor IF-2|uniref:translation initiation factor IF-2 n=1 Tax=Sphingorhabdus sp. TaxID=1902408 RepID=UPI000BC3A703|nr:translation initiation factor IF-2 [Sphingorhabdus sp.]OYY16457.1 MAG: translation initiation factor IF-2 [Sphingomonadales bacterium 35-56-22]OYY98224.1 MAG: translation initiation factor IF-2 [Sphingomonadales bacterium 28-56-43]OYZ60695.1 MAG: translation initiation factor IF-2 [Sphingomonadales bacterium 24-56-14]OZA83756.1 MAG: translation initiation factor IF-2 [Sphingomonadales bacterium 39-57-19]HQS11868.1 translation initiation factor IF-2 [Sphingorhabdus sp.]
MSDDTNNKPTLTRKPLTLSRSLESGEVKQTFSHGRTNKVVVEVKRKKLVGKPGYAPEAEVAAPPPPPPPPAAPVAAAPAPAPAAPAPRPTGNDMLSRQERQAKLLREAEEARLAMLEESSRREAEQRAQRAEEERQRAQANREEAAAPPPPPPAAATPAEPETSEPVAEEASQDAAAPAPRRFTPVEAPKRPEREREEVKKAPHRPTRGAADDRRQSGKLTVTRALEGDDGARARSLAALKRAREKEKRLHGGGSRQAQVKQTRDVVVPETITVQELANRMAEKGSDLVKALFKMGMPVTINETIDQDTAELLVEEFGHNITRVSDADVDIVHDEDVDAPETLKARPPVVTVMGHVDHGKTSLLDALRGANVVSGEAGGITQHIGAYQVKTKDGSLITFLDTPGHEAFTQMRQRGASVTDIVILVVAADDGLMPQTIEAIKHAKAANVPMIVAINKIDKEGANPQKVRERLLEHEVVVEAMGGDVQDVEVSALKKTGLDDLLDKLALQAEVMELKSNPDRAAEAVVVEAQLDKGRGAVATVLVKRGTLKRGDIFVVGAESGKVRALINDKGQQVPEAGPATPVEVLGLTGVPSAGDVLTVVENEARAREVALYRKEQSTKVRTAQVTPNLENLFDNLSATRAKEYPVVIKGDVQGSVEAIVTALNNISTDEIKVRVLLAGVGGITESDMLLAAASNAPLIGFNVRPNSKAAALAKRDRVRLKYFDVIYHLTADIAKEMAGELGPEIIETVVGRAEVKDVFKSGKRDKAAGLLVTEGIIKKGLHARLTREDVIVSKTTIASLRRFKDNIDEVRAGLECGVVLADTNDVKAGDMLEVFEVEERERTL